MEASVKMFQAEKVWTVVETVNQIAQHVAMTLSIFFSFFAFITYGIGTMNEQCHKDRRDVWRRKNKIAL